MAASSFSSSAAAAASPDEAARFEAYSRLQAAAAALGEKLPIPEILVIGGVSEGKSSVVEGLLGFRFNVRWKSTRRPLVLQMVHDPAALEPRCRFQEEDSEEYGSPMVMATAIADLIKQRTESHLRKIHAAVSSKPIVIRAEYAHCPSLTIIDTPGLQFEARSYEPESTPDEIRAMVKSLAAPPHRLLLFVQQSTVNWCGLTWLRTLKEIDPTFRRTMIVISKFDVRLEDFTRLKTAGSFLSASGLLGDSTHPFFVALPEGSGTMSNEEFRRQICRVDIDVLCQLRDNVEVGFNEEKHGSYIGFSCLRKYLESQLHKRYKEAALATLKLLEQRYTEFSMDLTRLDSKLATFDVSQLRGSAKRHVYSVCEHLSALLGGGTGILDGVAYLPDSQKWGKTTEEEQMHSGINRWPGINMPVKPANSSLKLYGGAAFARLMDELRCAAYSMECPQVPREQVANKLAALAGRCGSIRLTEAALTEAVAEIAQAAAQSWLAPLIDTACDRLVFVLQSLLDIARERKRIMDSQYNRNVEDMDSYVGFLAALRCLYYKFVEELSMQCKKRVHDHLDLICQRIGYDNDFLSGLGVTSFDLADNSYELEEAHENLSPKDQQDMTPNDSRPRKRHAKMAAYTNRNHLYSLIDADDIGSKSGSSYSTICTISAQYFAKMREEALIETNVPSILKSGFITPCHERLFRALNIDLFAVSDDNLKNMFVHFVAPGAVDATNLL